MSNYLDNWQYLFEDKEIKNFLNDGGLWGEGQGPSNQGRIAWIDFLKKFYKDTGKTPIKILEIGFGAAIDFQTMEKEHLLRPDGPYEFTGADVTPQFIEFAARNFPKLNPILIDASTTPFEDKYFHITYARHVLEHQQNYRFLLREMFRITSDRVFLNLFLPLVPNTDLDSIHYDNVFYHNRYSRNLFEKFITKRGWCIAEENLYKNHVKEGVDTTDHTIVLRPHDR